MAPAQIRRAWVQNAGTFYLLEDAPKFTRYMCEPVKLTPGSSPLDTPGYFVAGIVKGYLACAGFEAECAPAAALCLSVPCAFCSRERAGSSGHVRALQESAPRSVIEDMQALR